MCTQGALCAASTCTHDIDPGWSIFNVVVDTAAVVGSWDIGSEADVFVCFSDGTNSGCTNYIDNDPTPTWNATTGLIRDSQNNPTHFPGSSLTSGLLTVTVYDYDDISSDELIGTIYVGPVTQMQPGFNLSSANVPYLTWHLL